MRRAVLSMLGLLVLASACGNGREDKGGARWSRRVEGPVVATVNGVQIGLDEVRELVQATGLSPREALRRLEDDVLLTLHADSAGYDRSSRQGRETKRALVRAVLAQTVEAQVRPETISAQQVQERFDRARAANAQLAPEDRARYDAQIREQLVMEQRKLALAKLVAQLRARYGVVLNEAEVDALLSDKALWASSS